MPDVSRLVDSEKELRNILKQASDEEIRQLVHKKHSAELHKEHIFEEIRASEFPNIPSRKRCMFLLDTDQEEEAEADLRKMGYEDSHLSGKLLIKVEPIEGSSVILQTDAALLDVNNCNDPEIAEAARRYWRGTSQPVKPEVLFEGQYIIREVVKSYPPMVQ